MLAVAYNAEELGRYDHDQRLIAAETQPRKRRSDANTGWADIPVRVSIQQFCST
jgi:hypothetical protein